MAASSTSTLHNEKGYTIESNESQIHVSVRVRVRGSILAGALVSKGSALLGKIFRAGILTIKSPKLNYLNFTCVIATERDTVVSFKDLPTGIVVENSLYL